MAEPRAGAAAERLPHEEGDPEELLDDPSFEKRFAKSLVELGREFGLWPAPSRPSNRRRAREQALPRSE